MILEDFDMFNGLTIFTVALAAFFIRMDKRTQFSHPSLHLLALASIAGVIYSGRRAFRIAAGFS